jgi:hypothetical protein
MRCSSKHFHRNILRIGADCLKQQVCPSHNCTTPLSPVHPTARTPNANNSTFSLISDLMQDMLGGGAGEGMFPDSFVHLGGDEVLIANRFSIVLGLNEGLSSPPSEYVLRSAYFVQPSFDKSGSRQP